MITCFQTLSHFGFNFSLRLYSKATYNQQMDSVHVWYVLVPCAAAAVVAHPSTSHLFVNRVLWAGGYPYTTSPPLFRYLNLRYPFCGFVLWSFVEFCH